MLGRICDNMPEESAEEHGSDHTVQTDFRFNTGLMIHNTGGTWLEVSREVCEFVFTFA